MCLEKSCINNGSRQYKRTTCKLFLYRWQVPTYAPTHAHMPTHTHTHARTHARTHTIPPVPSGVGSTSLSSPTLDISLLPSTFMLVFFFSFYHPLMSSMLSFNVITLAARIHQFTQNPVKKLTALVLVIFFYTSVNCTHPMNYCNLPSIKGN